MEIKRGSTKKLLDFLPLLMYGVAVGKASRVNDDPHSGNIRVEDCLVWFLDVFSILVIAAIY